MGSSKCLTNQEHLALIKQLSLSNFKERTDLMDRAETAYKLQQDAQKVAEKAIRQLEEFIGEDSQVVSIH